MTECIRVIGSRRRTAVSLAGFVALVLLLLTPLPSSHATSRLLAESVARPEYTDWSVPVNLGAMINSGSNEDHPNLSKDGLSLFFHSNRPGGYGGLDIWVSHRATLDDPWQAPENLGPSINTAYDDRVPFLSPGQQWLIFGSTRPGGSGGIDLWVSRRADKSDDFTWEPATNLGSVINSAWNDDGAAMFEDDYGRLVLYFTSDRPGGAGGFDVYQSIQQTNGTFGAPIPVSEINSAGRDTRTAITRDGLELFLTTDRPGSQLLDIWTAHRNTTDDPWSLLGRVSTISSAANDGAPALSFGRRELYFYSNRAGGYGGDDLYMSVRLPVHGESSAPR
jgi:hypothetical protein